MEEPRESGELIPAMVDIDMQALRRAMVIAASASGVVMAMESQGQDDYVEVQLPRTSVTVTTEIGCLSTEFELCTLAMGPLDPYVVLLRASSVENEPLAKLLGREEVIDTHGYDFYVLVINPKVTPDGLGHEHVIHQIACVKDYGVDYTRRPMTALGMLLTSMT